jgi:hypothetical protein
VGVLWLRVQLLVSILEQWSARERESDLLVLEQWSARGREPDRAVDRSSLTSRLKLVNFAVEKQVLFKP